MGEREEGGALATSALVQLATWLSPAFPVGAFGYSHGFETAIAERRVANAEEAFGWIAALVRDGSGWNDLVLFAQAHAAARDGDAARLREVAELGEALAGSAERRTETMDLGAAFADASKPWRAEGEGEDEGGDPGPYPVAVAMLAAARAIPLEPALAAFAHGFAANLLAVALRLVPLGQRDGVRILHRLEPVLLHAAARAARSTPDDLGSATFLSDICALRHETTSPRLFRT